jgi:flagellar hook-associated protein 2
MSAAATADLTTNLGFLNITDGTISLYKDGEKKIINIDSSQSFGDLRSKIASAFSDVDLSMDNGFIKIYSKDGYDIEIGATNDTSNFTAIVGLQKSDQSTLESTRALYKVNDATKLTEKNVFKQGNIKEGTFTIGNEVFTIDNNTTVRDLVSMINGSEDATATAYWDSINGQLVITSRNSGSSYINIENGTSNLTEILGFTETDSSNNTILHVNNQTLGSNAKFTINGTNFTSNSNKITSDISRINGVTIDLKSITEGETVTLTIERDKDQLADALSDIVDSYNDLITNVDSQIASTGELHDQTVLKMLRNSLKSLMTGSDSGAIGYKTLDSIGICLAQASASNISTDNLSALTFDKDKFISAYDNDKDSLKALLVGSSTNSGILTKVEDLIENSLKSVTGYFDSQNTSYKKKITTLENKITKENSSISTYKAQLEKKFSQMDTLIGKIQQQYSSFLSS